MKKTGTSACTFILSLKHNFIKEYFVTELMYNQTHLNAPKNRKGGQGNYQYRSIDDILKAAKDVMPEGCYITMTDSVENIGGRNYICATATFFSGDDSISCQGVAWEPEKLAAMSMPQITGSCSSYARKSALSGLFAIDDNKEIDSLTQLETGASSVKFATEKQRKELKDFAVQFETTDKMKSDYIAEQLDRRDLKYTEAESILKKIRSAK